MIRNLFHALAAVALVFAVGWFVGQPAVHRQLAASQGARYAVLGLVIALALFALASLVRAFRPKKTPARSSLYDAASPARRGR
jgi:uncharacterized membrane protein